MKPGKPLKRIFAAIAGVAVLGGAGFGIYKAQESVPSVQDGVSYLQNEGYSNVHPVDQSFSLTRHGCRKNETPRTYETTKDGNTQDQVLCFSMFHHIKKPNRPFWSWN